MNDFEGWPPLRDTREERDLVYFAVKKEHDMDYQYDYRPKVLTYEDLIQQSIEEGTYHFDYHGHSYVVERNEDDHYDVLSDGQKIAEAMIEEGECITDIPDENKGFVRNTKSAYYENLYQKLFSKVRTKEYGVPSSQEENER